MKKYGLGCVVLSSLAVAEPQPIVIPEQLPAETTNYVADPMGANQAISTTVKDPTNKDWREYENRIVKARLRIKAAWTVMELKETKDVGTVGFTISRTPLVTFSIVRAPLEDSFDFYVSSAALKSLYPKVEKKIPYVFAGRKGVMVQGILEDERRDESHFSTDGKSFYRVSFSAPKDDWAEALKHFEAIQKDFRWLP